VVPSTHRAYLIYNALRITPGTPGESNLCPRVPGVPGVESGCLGPQSRQLLAVYFKALLDHDTPESSILRRNARREPFLEQPDVLGTDAAAAANEPRAHI
jgi:hypothetical protein